MRSSRFRSRSLGLLSIAVLALAAAVSQATLPCGPFTDLSSGDPFCPFVLEIFTLGITTGTTPTTYSPSDYVTRLQMAAFLSRTVDGVLKRGSRRAALGRLWTPQSANAQALELMTVSFPSPTLIQADSADIWVQTPTVVSRFRASDGQLVQNYPLLGYSEATGFLVLPGWFFLTAKDEFSSQLYFVRTHTNLNGIGPGFQIASKAISMTFDGIRIFKTDQAGSLSIVTVGDPNSPVWGVATVTTGFTQLWGAIFDGTSVWVTDFSAGTLLKLDASGAILQTVTVGTAPSYPAFDGTNLWVPNSGGGANSVSVVRASSGTVLATLTGNGITQPASAAFDGERILLTNQFVGTVSLFKAADMTPLSSISTGGGFPYGACSDGINFWVTLQSANQIARF